MPNNCCNKLTITSTPEDIEIIAKHLTDNLQTPFDFNNLVPKPKELDNIRCVHSGNSKHYYYLDKYLEDHPEDDRVPIPSMEWLERNALDPFTLKRLNTNYGTPDWYEWCCKHWGTKWNAYDIKVMREENKIEYNFLTAWAEPRPIMRALIDYLGDTQFDTRLEMRWTFVDENENYQGVIDGKTEV